MIVQPTICPNGHVVVPVKASGRNVCPECDEPMAVEARAAGSTSPPAEAVHSQQSAPEPLQIGDPV